MSVLGRPLFSTTSYSEGTGRYSTQMKLLSRDNMEDRPIMGERDWQRYDIVLDVPADSTTILIDLEVGGKVGSKGRVWFDDIQFEVVNKNVPVTDMFQSTKPTNMGFEDGLSGWRIAGRKPQILEVGTDTEVAYEGTASGFISRAASTETEESPLAFLDLYQIVRTDNYKGKRVSFSAYIKTEGVKQGRIYMGSKDAFGRGRRWLHKLGGAGRRLLKLGRSRGNRHVRLAEV